MDIKDVKLTSSRPPANKKEKPLNDIFHVVTKDGNEMMVPHDPLNRHYADIRDWYNRKQNKPFDFDFEPVVEADPEPVSRDKGNHIVMTAEQTEDADLPPINLTQKQQSEIRRNAHK